MSRYKDLISHAIPALIAIIISGIIDVEIALYSPLDEIVNVFLKTPVAQEISKKIIWSFLQIIPAFVFGFISDHYWRKNVLIFSQILGVLGGIALYIFAFEAWVVILLGLTFNPLSVARAAMLDNYPRFSALKIIAATYIAKNAAWIFIDFFSSTSFKLVTICVLISLVVNTFLTFRFLKDRYDDKNKIKENQTDGHEKNLLLNQNKLPITASIVALAFAEAGFYLLWIHLESAPALQKWLSVTTIATLLGTAFVMLYRKIPHLSIITILYGAGAVMLFITLLYTHNFHMSYEGSLISVMSHYCVIGGIYLPFATDGFIEMAGTKRKAVGSAFSEMSDTFALIIASVVGIIIGQNPYYSMILILIFYVFATLFQRYSENKAVIKTAFS